MSKAKKSYFYFDNWSGAKKEFRSLRTAKAEAKNETGVSISIVELPSNKIIHTPASGHTPA